MLQKQLSVRPAAVHAHPQGRSAGIIPSFILKATLAGATVFIVFLIYSSSLQGPFLFDDGHNIQDNPHIRMIRLSWDGLKRAALESPLSNRPVAYISFAMNYYFHGYHVVGYHLVNIVIHIMAGVLLFLFIKTTMELPPVRDRYGHHPWVPYVAVLLWIVHPLHTQSVTFIVQRMNSMAAMFYILSMWFYATARLAPKNLFRLIRFAACGLAGLLAIGTKETAATLPFFIFLYEWYFFQNLSRAWLKRNLFFFSAILVLMIALALMYLDMRPFEKIMAGYHIRDFTLSQRVLTEFRVVILYLSRLLYPHPGQLNLDYDFPLSHSLMDPFSTLLSLAMIVGLIGLALALAKKDRLLSFCLLWFFGNLVIESSVIGLEIVFEHRTYLPSMLIFVLITIALDRLFRSQTLKAVAICSAVLVLSAWTYERNTVWSSDVLLWSDVVKKSPQKARPPNNLGNALKNRGNLAEAIRQFNAALRINPNYAKAHNNLGTALAAQGNSEDAIKQFALALLLKPDYATAHNNIGVALARQGRFEQAIIHFEDALRIKPEYAKVHNNLGAALVRLGRIQEAMGHFYSAVRLKPDDLEAYQNIRICLQLLKKNDKSSEAASASR